MYIYIYITGGQKSASALSPPNATTLARRTARSDPPALGHRRVKSCVQIFQYFQF